MIAKDSPFRFLGTSYLDCVCWLAMSGISMGSFHDGSSRETMGKNDGFFPHLAGDPAFSESWRL